MFSSHLCSPTFVSIAGFECSYDSFRLSLQPRGFMSKDLMAFFVQYFNDDHKLNTENIYDRNKVAFTPFLVVLLFYLFFYLKFSARTNLSFLMSSYTEFFFHISWSRKNSCLILRHIFQSPMSQNWQGSMNKWTSQMLIWYLSLILAFFFQFLYDVFFRHLTF